MRGRVKKAEYSHLATVDAAFEGLSEGFTFEATRACCLGLGSKKDKDIYRDRRVININRKYFR